jgi:hypothetical protein
MWFVLSIAHASSRASEKTIGDILGSPDDMKFRSSMTLFDAVSKQEVFAEGRKGSGDDRNFADPQGLTDIIASVEISMGKTSGPRRLAERPKTWINKESQTNRNLSTGDTRKRDSRSRTIFAGASSRTSARSVLISLRSMPCRNLRRERVVRRRLPKAALHRSDEQLLSEGRQR